MVFGLGKPNVEKMAEKKNVEGLIKALRYKKISTKYEDSDVRTAAAKALGNIGDPRAVEPLIDALKDVNIHVRWAAAIALGDIGDPCAIDPLIDTLKDTDRDVKNAAAIALGDIDDRRAIDPLIDTLKDEGSFVREAADEALENPKNTNTHNQNINKGNTDIKNGNNPEVEKTNYYDTDDLGTRHESLEFASNIWLNRLKSQSKEPFVLYIFKDETSAKNALLELPCIHISQDSGKLICTEVFHYGYYKISEGYEAVLMGDELSYELWNAARTSFLKHNGKLKNEQAPDTKIKKKNDEIDEVKFIREDKNRKPYVYQIYKAPNAATAKNFLKNNPVDRQFYYIIIETPEGNYGRDIQGIYKEKN